MALRQRVSLLVAPLVPAAKVEVEIVVAEVETKASTLAQETVVVAAARARRREWRRVHGRLVPWREEAAPRPLPFRDYALCSRQISGRPMQDCRAKDGRNSNRRG